MKKEILNKLMLALVVMLAGFAFTACGDDNDEPQTQVYSYGWESFNSTDLSFLADMNAVETAFKNQLGSSPFSLSGSSADCDAKVVAACEKAAATLKDREWVMTGTFNVTNDVTGKVVYSLQVAPTEK